MIPEARIARVSWWTRIRALFHWRSKAELLAAYEHERGLREAKERELARLEEVALDVMTENYPSEAS